MKTDAEMMKAATEALKYVKETLGLDEVEFAAYIEREHIPALVRNSRGETPEQIEQHKLDFYTLLSEAGLVPAPKVSVN